MSSSKGEKQYGLIIPKKQQPVTPKPTNIFADDNESDEDDGTDWVKKALKAEGEKNKMKKQTKLSMQKALKEDPTIYQYDEVYDDMEHAKSLQKTSKQEEKKPKYIQNLLRAAERRKKEQEHRIERMVQKEREAEGTMYADKESFVTSAYRAKLEEFKKMEEEESRMSRLEAIGDVTKQQDMSGFYRHLYEQTVENPTKSESTTDLPNESEKDNGKSIEAPTNVDTPKKDTTHKEESDVSILNRKQDVPAKVKKSRQYRQRVVETEDSDNEIENKKEVEEKQKRLSPEKSKATDEINPVEPQSKKQKQESEDKVQDKVLPQVLTESNHNTEKSEGVSKTRDDSSKTDNTDDSINKKVVPEKKEKSRIWEKRTVGPVFEAALQRYYARKAMRLSGA